MAKLDTISSENSNIKVRHNIRSNESEASSIRRATDTKDTYKNKQSVATKNKEDLSIEDNESDNVEISKKVESYESHKEASTLRGRDTVYVDSDDDVTSLIERVVASGQSVVALVPSAKRGVLNSLVNLKLIRRAAERAHKKITVVTTESALISMASSLNIPVAKSVNAQSVLRSRRDDASDENEEVIDGNDIAVGELDDMARSVDDIPEDKEISAAVASIEADDKHRNDLDADGVNDDEEQTQRDSVKSRHTRTKVPNFGVFRAKLIGSIMVIVGLGIFVAWAVVFAPHTDIIIKAKTIPKDIVANLSLIPDGKADVSRNILPAVVKTIKSTSSIQFDATGTRDQGDKATGNITICNKKPIMLSLTSLQQNVVSIKAGTQLRSTSGKIYTLDASTTVKGYSIGNGADVKQNCVSAKATASNIGDDFNISDSTKLSISGYGADLVTAVAPNGFSGGTRKTVKVVTRQDIDGALAKLKEQDKSDESKHKLEEQLVGETIIADSFTQQTSSPKASPAIDQISNDGKANLTVEITYSLLAVRTTDLKTLLDAKLSPTSSQRIYDDGLAKLAFKRFKAERRGYTVAASTVGYVGPIIKEDDVKQKAVGKKQAEIKQELMKIPGVQDVTVKMSPFWVSTPSSADKVGVKFSINQ